MEEYTFIAESQPLEGTYTKIDLEGHTLYADQPPEDGGEDKQACPASIMVGSLVACESMIVRRVIKKMRLNVKDHRVHAKGLLPKDYSKDGRGFSKIHLTFIFDTDEPIEKLEKLVASIKNACPILNTIKASVEITTEVKKASL